MPLDPDDKKVVSIARGLMADRPRISREMCQKLIDYMVEEFETLRFRGKCDLKASSNPAIGPTERRFHLDQAEQWNRRAHVLYEVLKRAEIPAVCLCGACQADHFGTVPVRREP